MPEIGRDTRLSTLVETIHTCKPVIRSLSWKHDGDLDEVYPGIYVGDGESSKNISNLKRLGISHVLNTADGDSSGMVTTGYKFYRGSGINYQGFTLADLPTTNISVYFKSASDFIDSALAGRGKILVHCLMGRSRSATLVIVYLMLRRGLNAVAAISLMRRVRDVRPNDGFLMQIAELDNKLRRERGTLT